MKFYDSIIIGAGAAGLMCAATAGARGRKVLLLDHAKAVGEKIRISGGGRCNFTNLFASPKNFISNNPHFCVSALKRYTQHDFIALVKKHQIAFHEKTLGQLFCDISSKQIIEMLLDECAAGGVEIMLEKKVDEVEWMGGPRHEDGVTHGEDLPTPVTPCLSRGPSASVFRIKVGQEYFQCTSLVIATGGISIPKMGASGFGYDIARQFKIKIIEPKPALVPFTFDEKLLQETKNLSGIAVNAIVKIGKVSFEEAILFTHKGLSGPAILQISSYFKEGDEVLINMAPHLDVFAKLQEEKKLKPKQEVQTILATILPKRLAEYIAQKNNCAGNLADLSNQKLKEIANSINAWKLVPSGTEGFAKAEVTLGGVDVDEISSKTFECKKVPGLFFIGEVLDVTGWLGGFNFQWAWSSGKAAGECV